MVCFVIFITAIILFFMGRVFMALIYDLYYRSVSHYLSHQKQRAETFAFVFRTLALLAIGYPSIVLLYRRSAYRNVDLIVKLTGRQWYWRWEISNLQEDAVPIYILLMDDLRFGEYRLLEVDNVLILPADIFIQFNITRSDVIHRFAIPSLGLKVDAIPGTLRIVTLNKGNVGRHYGQCSEICGMGHSFMPVCIEIASFTRFINWAKSLL